MSSGEEPDVKYSGRMNAYAFFVHKCREEHENQHPGEKIVFVEFSKKCVEKWKTMNEREKNKFQEMALQESEKFFENERKQIKDPNAPTSPLSAFSWFCNDERGNVKAANPKYGVEDVAKELGKRWSGADITVKQKYEAMAEKDKARYQREMTEYKKKGKPTLLQQQHQILVQQQQQILDPQQQQQQMMAIKDDSEDEKDKE